MLLNNIRRFYSRECCWPYGISFYLTLLIFYLDLVLSPHPQALPSMFAYGIITAYYVQNIRYYRKNLLSSENPEFFIGFLTFKIVTWGLILVLLLALA